MDLEKIGNLRKKIMASIGECKEALERTNGDLDNAFEYLKKDKTEPIIRKTGVSIDRAFELYREFNGDTDKAIARILYLKNSKEWEEKNAPKIQDYMDELNSIRTVYNLFELCPMEFSFNGIKIFEVLYNFYSAVAPGELDNITMSEDQECFDEIRKALSTIDLPDMVDLFNAYIDADKQEDEQKLDELDHKFWEKDEEFKIKLKKFILDNIDAVFNEKIW